MHNVNNFLTELVITAISFGALMANGWQQEAHLACIKPAPIIPMGFPSEAQPNLD